MMVNRSNISWYDYGLTGEQFPEKRNDSKVIKSHRNVFDKRNFLYTNYN